MLWIGLHGITYFIFAALFKLCGCRGCNYFSYTAGDLEGLQEHVLCTTLIVIKPVLKGHVVDPTSILNVNTVIEMMVPITFLFLQLNGGNFLVIHWILQIMVNNILLPPFHFFLPLFNFSYEYRNKCLSQTAFAEIYKHWFWS